MNVRRMCGARVLTLLATLVTWHADADSQECAADTSAHASTTVVYRHISGAQQATIYTPTADGAVQAVDAATGAQLWAFVPPEAVAAAAGHDRITDLRILRFDANGDGSIDIDSGDRIWLYFGLRESGPYYYALDVTERSAPHVLWKAGADTLQGLTDAWSTPTIARVRVAGAAQNGEHFVLVFGGGYDAVSGGNRVFMVDAATGQLLWSAGGEGSDGDLALKAMTHAMAARIAVLDTDGDKYADRMYAVDVSGQVWRFDIWNGQGRSTLVTGGVLADLSDDNVAASERLFFSAPDVALIQSLGREPYYNIAVGSGDPRLVGGVAAHDFFYAVRDKAPFQRRTQSSYDGAAVSTAEDLVDISKILGAGAASQAGGAAGVGAISPDAPGWKLDLRSLSGDGERVVGESVTADGVVLFTTFQPSSDASECAVGSSRVYAVRIDSGTPGLDFNDDGKLTVDDLSTQLPSSGLPGAVRIEMGKRSAGAQTGEGPAHPDPGTDPGTGPGPLPREMRHDSLLRRRHCAQQVCRRRRADSHFLATAVGEMTNGPAVPRRATPARGAFLRDARPVPRWSGSRTAR